MPILYANYFGIMQEVARTHGYALALHGSLVRDMDLIAVPWIDEPSDPIVLIKAIYNAVGWTEGETVPTCFAATDKPHGRKAYALPTGGGGYVDVSVMPIAK